VQQHDHTHTMVDHNHTNHQNYNQCSYQHDQPRISSRTQHKITQPEHNKITLSHGDTRTRTCTRVTRQNAHTNCTGLYTHIHAHDTTHASNTRHKNQEYSGMATCTVDGHTDSLHGHVTSTRITRNTTKQTTTAEHINTRLSSRLQDTRHPPQHPHI
jgi:hypothetical protein